MRDTSVLQKIPVDIPDYSIPEPSELKRILESNDIDDDLFSVALRLPVLKGNIALDFEDRDNPLVCIPQKLIENLICETHKKFKP